MISKIEKHGGIRGLFDKLRVNPNEGLNDDIESLDILARSRVFGRNDPVIPKLPSFFSCLVEVMNDYMVLFLIFFGLISFILDLLENKYIWLEYSSIYISVFIIVLVLGLNDYTKDKMLIEFEIELENQDVRVLRNKKEINIPRRKLVVGDLLVVSSGNKVPVDGFLIRSDSIVYEYENRWYKHYNVNFKESNLDDIPMVYSGSNILSGKGTILVLAVGANTDDAKRKIIRFKNRKKIEQSEEAYLNIEKNHIVSSNMNNINKNTDYSEFNSDIKMNDQRIENEPDNRTYLLDEPQESVIIERKQVIDKGNKNKKKDIEIEPLPIISKIIKLKKGSHKSNSNLYSRSPFKESLNKLSIFIVKIGCIVSLACTLIIIYRLYVRNSYMVFVSHIPDSILYGLLMIVVLTSKGIPLTINMCLNNLIQKMRDQNTMIKNIGVCSAMACSNILCTDYSKIMTKGEMKISSFYIEDKIIEEFSKSKFKDISEDSYEFFCEAISINSSSYFSEKATNNSNESVNEIFQNKRFFGDSIDSALLSYLKSIRVDYMKYRNNIDRQVIDRSNYEISKKIQYCVINMADKVDYVRVYVRGSPCVLLKKIKYLISNDAQLSDVNFEKYHELKDICKETLCIGLIPVLICFRDINKEHYYSHKKLFLREDEETYEKYIIKDLTLISIIRLQEEIKPNMDELINEIQSYGINIKLVTSYEKEFACHIGDKLGILKEPKTDINQNDEEKELSSSVKLENISKNIQEKNLNDPVNVDTNLNLNPSSNNKEKLRRNFKEKKYKTLTDYNSILEKLNTNKNVLDTSHDIRKYVDPDVFRLFSKHTNNIDIKIHDYLKLSQLIEKSQIISRAGELDKFISIALLREKGGIVINLGEGVNDALAMSNSNISISMSPNSTDICREMADIIIMDGNFTNICSLIINSRNLFVTIRKFLQFYLTAIFVLLLTVFFCTIINFNIYPSQVLWFNLVVNTFGPFSFSMEQPRKNSLSRKRFSEDIKIINNNMIIFIIIESVIQCSILSLIIIYGDYIFNVESDVGISYKYWGPGNGQHTTILLSVMIFLQVFSAFVARNLEKKVNVFQDIKYNKFFPLVQFIIVLLHLILISQGSSYIKVRMISYLNLIKCVLISSLILFTPFILSFFINEEKDVIKQEKVHHKLSNDVVKRKKSDYGLKII